MALYRCGSSGGTTANYTYFSLDIGNTISVTFRANNTEYLRFYNALTSQSISKSDDNLRITVSGSSYKATTAVSGTLWQYDNSNVRHNHYNSGVTITLNTPRAYTFIPD